MLVMIVIGIAIFGLAIAVMWFLLARGPRVTEITKDDFDGTYDDLVAKGELVERDRDAAWRDFHAWERADEKERLAWEETTDE